MNAIPLLFTGHSLPGVPSGRGRMVMRCLAWLLGCFAVWVALAHAQAAVAQAGPETEGDLACAPVIEAVWSAPADAQGEPPTAGWQRVTLPDRWVARWPGFSGPVWYRVDWQRGCGGAARQANSVALALDWLNLAGSVSINGDLLWRDRHLAEPYSRSWNVPRVWVLPESSLHEGSNAIWIKVFGLASQNPGLGPVHLGPPDVLYAAQEVSIWRQRTTFLINLAISAVLCCLFFSIWVMHRSQRASGWYAVTTLFWILFACNILVTEGWPFADTAASVRANIAALVLFIASYCVFTWRFCGLEMPRTSIGLGIFVATLCSLLLIQSEPEWIWITQFAQLSVSVIFLVNAVFLLVHSLCTRRFEELVLALCGVVFIAAAVHDVLLAYGVLMTPPVTPYTSMLSLVTISILLGRRIARNMQRIARFNEELSHAVAQACDDLAKTMAREHSLALENSVLQERLRIAQDLHDSLGGSLVSAIAFVEQARDPLDNTRYLSMLKLLRNDLRQVIDSGAHLGATAAPPSPQAWMAPLRHRYVNLFDELEIDSEWSIPQAWRAQPGTLVCLALTRLLEEALANIIKHSRARHVVVELLLPEQDFLVLRIEDDGVGFDVDAVRQAGLSVGMRSMQARMARLGGTLTVRSQRGQTVLEARLRLSRVPGAAPSVASAASSSARR